MNKETINAAIKEKNHGQIKQNAALSETPGTEANRAAAGCCVQTAPNSPLILISSILHLNKQLVQSTSCHCGHAHHLQTDNTTEGVQHTAGLY